MISSSETASAAAMTDARTATYVVDSDVHGAMGAAFVPFSKRSDAASFAAKYHGHTRAFDEIDSGVLASGDP